MGCCERIAFREFVDISFVEPNNFGFEGLDRRDYFMVDIEVSVVLFPKPSKSGYGNGEKKMPCVIIQVSIVICYLYGV